MVKPRYLGGFSFLDWTMYWIRLKALEPGHWVIWYSPQGISIRFIKEPGVYADAVINKIPGYNFEMAPYPMELEV